MQSPLEFYQLQKATLTQESLRLKKVLVNLGIFRFSAFIITCCMVYLTFGTYPDVFIFLFLGIVLFTFLVFKYVAIKKSKAIVDAKIKINQTEIDALKGAFYNLESGNEFIDKNHFYSNDIDLFGRGSFFQYLNRTQTVDGKTTLANLLTANTTTAILEKQDAIKELAKKVFFRQHFSALASVHSLKKSGNNSAKWMLNYTSILPSFLPKLQMLFAFLSLLLLGLVSFGELPFSYLLTWFFIGLLITGRYVKKTNALYTKVTKASKIFHQYHQLLNEIEQQKFVSEILIEKQNIIASEKEKASAIFKKFAKRLDAFDNRNNIIIAILGNGLLLWEIVNAYKVEKWITTYKHTVEKWFEVIAYFDAQNSLANFTFNNPDFIFPEINTKTSIIKANDLGHPLLNATKRVDNNFIINKEQFFIVTGANMAGKSTFLRTVSLAIVMANCGLPVCAKEFTYAPIMLITSMRASDSLTEDESYFYSELKRLKFIVDAINKEDYFIILDEILKGTNSKDKAEGSKRFVEKLTKSKSTGIIATHDVSLCELQNEFSTIKNYYFEAEINNNELYFDYKLKAGICKNMNASFLLKKMDIV